MKIIPVIFEDHEIRRLYDEKTETWLFSVVDIIQILTQQPNYKAARNYWKVLKNRLAKEGSQLVTNCNQLKLPAADGKNYLTGLRLSEPQALTGHPCSQRLAADRCRDQRQNHSRLAHDRALHYGEIDTRASVVCPSRILRAAARFCGCRSTHRAPSEGLPPVD